MVRAAPVQTSRLGPDSAARESSEAVRDAPRDRLGAARYADLLVNLPDVGLDGVDAHEQLVGDPEVAQAGADEVEPLGLTGAGPHAVLGRGQPGRRRDGLAAL